MVGLFEAEVRLEILAAVVLSAHIVFELRWDAHCVVLY